jgi:hypothetical protein
MGLFFAKDRKNAIFVSMSEKATIYWAKAQENLESAVLLLAEGKYNACTNRAYYGGTASLGYGSFAGRLYG